MVDPRAILEACEQRLPAMVAATDRLVSIDSGSYDAAGVNGVCSALEDMLSPLGFEVRRWPLPRRGHRMAATLPLSGDGPKVSILGHADTVWPAGTVAEWGFEARGELISGPGVGDMKSCLVMAAHAVDVALAAGLPGIGSIELLVVPDEELGSPGSRGWIEERVRDSAACLGLEAGWPGGGVVIERGAVGALVIEARGRAAHCSGHEGAGASALRPLARLVGDIEDLSDPGAGVIARVGIFRGGTARQVVPDRAELHVDLRAADALRGRELLARVTELVERASRGEVRLKLHGGFTRPAFPPSASAGLWRMARAIAAELAIPIRPVASRGGGDASFAAALGVPTLDGLGPVCHDACARDERVEVRSIAERAALLACMLIALGRQPAAAQKPSPGAASARSS